MVCCDLATSQTLTETALSARAPKGKSFSLIEAILDVLDSGEGALLLQRKTGWIAHLMHCNSESPENIAPPSGIRHRTVIGLRDGQ